MKLFSQRSIFNHASLAILLSTALSANSYANTEKVTVTAETNAVKTKLKTDAKSKEQTPLCSPAPCKTPQGFSVKLVSKGEKVSTRQNVPNDRRVEVVLDHDNAKHRPASEQGKAIVKGDFLVRMPLGGIFWATEDPAITAPRLSINAPQAIKFDGSNSYTARFNYFSNYLAFIERLELVVYKGNDIDLVTPLYSAELSSKLDSLDSHGEFTWQVEPKSLTDMIAGDSLRYVLRAYDSLGNIDETQSKLLQLVTPQAYDNGSYLSQGNSQTGNQQSLSANNVAGGASSNTASNTAQDTAVSISNFGANQLIKQNIPITGSRVRIFGQDIPEGYNIEINSKSYPIDLQRKFASEHLLPIGEHVFNLTLSGEKGTVTKPLKVDVTGKYMFLAALADVTISENHASGNIEPLGSDDSYDEYLLLEGRLAFYLKGKIKGKYLVTAHADTQERQLSKLFNGFLDKDPVDIFRRLDPDKYYPVYGDDSTTTRDVDTQGRFYVRVDWDKSLALWGNFNTGMTDTEYGQYNRSLYGMALNWKSTESNVYGQAKTQVNGFLSEAQTALGHSEFLGTGGSLYYLKHTDVLPGSDKLVIEVRNPDTGLTVDRIDLTRDADYQLDELQGRIILSRPLMSFARDGSESIIRDQPLDGNQLLLLVDYEYLPNGFSADHLTLGGRAKHWFNDNIALGFSYVDENRAGNDYKLAGVDLTLQAGQGSYIKVEHSNTDNNQAPIFYSDNGGLTFKQSNITAAQLSNDGKSGDALSIEARANLKALGYTEQELTLAAWHKNTAAGFSIARRDLNEKMTEQGAQVSGQFSKTGQYNVSVSKQTSGENQREQASVFFQQNLDASGNVSAEIKQVNEQRSQIKQKGLLAALGYRQRLTPNFELYGIAQGTLDADKNYKNNDLITLGGKYLLADRSNIGAEYATGHRGDTVALDIDYHVNNDHSLYSRYSWSTDTTSPLLSSSNSNGLTFGHRSKITNNLNIYNETQTINATNETGFVHVFGLNYLLGQGWNLGGSLQHGELSLEAGNVDRDAATISAGFRDKDLQWLSKVEYREDQGAEQRTQWLTTNRLTYLVNDSWRLAAKYNFSDTEDAITPDANAKFTEASVGFAYRPFDNNRWNLLGKYTYLYDLRGLAQTNFGTDQKSNIYTLEGTYRYNIEWEFAAKAGRRTGELRAGRGIGEFFQSTVNFAALQARYHIVKRWDGLIEYRTLSVTEDSSTRKGWLLGVDRHIGKHFKVGLGYNFTDFSDDLKLTDYTYQGLFINLIGKY